MPRRHRLDGLRDGAALVRDPRLREFRAVLLNVSAVSVAHATAWFALVYFVYLQTHSVFASGLVSGLYFLFGALTGVWFGSLVDHVAVKTVLQASTVASLVLYAGAITVAVARPDAFRSATSAWLWLLVGCVMAAVGAGGIRSIALATLVTSMVPARARARANGLVGAVSGSGFIVSSALSGLALGFAGLRATLLITVAVLLLALGHLTVVPLPQRQARARGPRPRVHLRSTARLVRAVPGLAPLLAFSTANNLLGGAVAALMDPYGLSMVSVQEWGVLWSALGSLTIVGGLVVAVTGLPSRPVRLILLLNAVIWAAAAGLGLRQSVVWMVAGLAVFMAVSPFVEAAEQTVLQTVVPLGNQGRVFGLSQSIEQAAAPLAAFVASPLAQWVFMPFMTGGEGARWIGPWLGTGPPRGIALLFLLAGSLGALLSVLALRSTGYRRLRDRFTLVETDQYHMSDRQI